jgi:transposase
MIPIRIENNSRNIKPVIGRRNIGHGSGLGKFRWVVERAISWLHQFRRLRSRWEREPRIHDAFLKLGCAMICFRQLLPEFC